MSTWNPQANKIFLESLAFEDDSARSQYLESACVGNSTLRAEVEALLDSHQRSGKFLYAGSWERPYPDAARIRPPFPAGTTLAGKYVVRRQLGTGGMGVVLLADQTQPVHREVAIKLIKSGLDVHNIALRFDQERNALALMDHPHIARIFDAGIVDLVSGDELLAQQVVDDELRSGVPFFAMEYIEGVPITDYCDRHRLGLRQRLELFIPVCHAVQHAHQKGVVHRDLKPTNILVATIDGEPIAKVIDFGVAKVTTGKLIGPTLNTSFGNIVGTLEYMSPEQAHMSGDIDTRSDVYALGVILYELLSGSVPHSREDFQQVGLDQMLQMIQDRDPLAPSSKLSASDSLPNIAASRDTLPARLVRSIQGDLDWIVMKALDRQRERRYESVAGLAADVRRFLDEEPVVARPPSALYRLTKAYRRHRVAFLAAGLALTLLVLGILGTSAGFLAASRNASRANKLADRASAAEQQARAALADAEQQRDDATTQKNISQAVTDFLIVDLLQQANVSLQADRLMSMQAMGLGRQIEDVNRNPTLLELIDRAALELAPDRIERKFPDQPAVQAALLRQLGFAYNSIGEYEKALPLLRRALGVLTTLHGPQHEDTLAALGYLIGGLQGTDRFDRAIETAQDLANRSEQKYGLRDERTLKSQLRVSAALAIKGNLAQSIKIAEQVRQLSNGDVRLVYSKTHAEFESMIEFELACRYHRGKRTSEAIEMLERAYLFRQDYFSHDHPKTIIAGIWLASAYHSLLMLDKSRPLYEQLVPRIQELYGESHPHTLNGLESLAAGYHRLGDPERAVEIYEDLVQRRVNRHGAFNERTLRTRANLAVNQLEAKQTAAAIDNFRLVYEHGHRMRPLIWAVEPYARALEHAGRMDEAEVVCREHLESVRQLFADDPGQRRGPLFSLALNLLRQEKFKEAEPILSEVIELNAARKADNWNSFNLLALHGATLLRQGRIDESEPLLLKGHAGMAAQFDRIPINVRHHVRDAIHWFDRNL